jgi:transposase
MSEYAVYVGIDWGTAEHQVAVVDPAGTLVLEQAVPHTAPALHALTDALIARAGGDPTRVAVAIEVPRGPVVETVLERGGHVYALNPKQLDRFRDRYTVAGAKDDRRDARVLGSALRTDPSAFRRVQADAPAIIALRELSRTTDDLQEDFSRLTNRLREQLQRIWPGLLRVCPAADEPWLWALLEQAPTPGAAARLSRSTLAALLRTHRIRRVSADTLRALLQAPAMTVAPGTPEAVQATVALLLPRLRLVHAQREACARQLDAQLTALSEPAPGQPGEHRDAAILRSVPGIGSHVAATMLAEAAALLQTRSYYGLRAHSGIAPVTKQSGKTRTVAMRYACNPRLRDARYHWGRVSIQRDPASRRQYATLRQHGHSHGWWMACSGCSWPCCGPGRSMTPSGAVPKRLDKWWGVLRTPAAAEGCGRGRTGDEPGRERDKAAPGPAAR